jgi:RNA polymerase sigma-70 factor (ECF subfamily)
MRKPFHEVALEEIPEIPESHSLDEDLQRRLDFQIVSKILSTFPARDRELISLKYGAELTNREISRLTGLSESNVGTILSRVVAKLRKEWEQDHG